MFKKNQIYLITLILLFGCTKQLDISEFSDDFDNYSPELRIEALILPSNNTAIVRIDRSVLINDTDVYNCKDDDFGELTEDACIALGGTWHGSDTDSVADCGDWDPLLHDLGKDGVEGDPQDDDEDCADCGFTDDACQEACREEDSIGENNGIPDCGEPNVDETDEIIKNIHVMDCSVKIMNQNYECAFVYDENAGSFFYNANFGKEDSTFIVDNIETPSYGAYVPSESCSNFDWNNYSSDYSFECECPNYGTIQSKDPIQIPSPVVFYNESDVLSESRETKEFTNSISSCLDNECLKSYSSIWDEQNQNYETIYFGRYAFNEFIYYSSIDPYYYYQSVQYFYDLNNSRYLYYHGHPDGATEIENIHGNAAFMGEAVVTELLDEFSDLNPIDKYYYEMFTFSEEYKNYYFFDLLDLRDPVRTNLRKLDESGNPAVPVMGAFGAMNSQKIYFEIIDCFEYDNQQSCEDTNNTKSVCQWYDEDNNFGDINNNGIQDNNESNMPSQFLPICGPIKLPPLES